MNEKKELLNANNEKVEAEVLAYLENTTSGKKYIYYTLNETVGVGPSSTIKIYVSKMKQGDFTLDTPITDEDWDMLKNVMSDSIKGIVSSNIKYLPLSLLTDNVSVSDRAIAMPMSYDYINKQKEIYSKNVVETPMESTQEPVVNQTVETPIAPVTPEVMEATQVADVMPTQELVAPKAEQPQIETQVQETELQEDTTASSESTAGRSLEPIDISSIEAKYTAMIEELNGLKEKELEAAKRYNATLELTSMHSEQHANYVQNNIKENVQNDVGNQPVEMPAVEPATLSNPNVIEPATITPVVPSAPTQNVTPSEIETNWFDMPNN